MLKNFQYTKYQQKVLVACIMFGYVHCLFLSFLSLACFCIVFYFYGPVVSEINYTVSHNYGNPNEKWNIFVAIGHIYGYNLAWLSPR